MRTTAGVKVPLSSLLATGAEVAIFLGAGTLRVGGAFGLLSGCKVISFPCSKSLTCFSRDSISSAIAPARANCLDVSCTSVVMLVYFTACFRSYSIDAIWKLHSANNIIRQRMKKSSSGVNLDGVLLFGFLVNPEPFGIFALDLLRQDRPAPAATVLEKCMRGLTTSAS